MAPNTADRAAGKQRRRSPATRSADAHTTTMKRYRVQSGDMDTVVWADSYDAAIEKGLRESRRPGAMLGKLIGVQADGEEEVLCGTEAFLQRLRAKLGPLPAPPKDASPEYLQERGLRATGLTETQLTRQFMSSLIEQGKNPFAGMADHLIQQAREEHPEIVARAYAKFGFPRPKPWWQCW